MQKTCDYENMDGPYCNEAASGSVGKKQRKIEATVQSIVERFWKV